jgi:hypothetical protein
MKGFQSCLPTLPAYFPFESSFFGNLGASKVHQRTISPENTKTCWPDKILKQYGGDAVLIKKKTAFGQLMKLTREFGSERSRSANIVISTFTNNYLVLVVASVFFQSYFTCVLFKRGYLSGASWLLFGTPRPPSPHDSLHDEWFHEEIYPLSSSGCRNIRGATRVCFYQCHWCQKIF